VAGADELDRAIPAIHETRVAPFSGGRDWKSMRLPVQQKQVSSIAAEPFADGRLYLATNGSGIFVWSPEGHGTNGSSMSGAR